MTTFWICVAAYWGIGLIISTCFMIYLLRWAGPRLPRNRAVTVYLTLKWSIEWLPIAAYYVYSLWRR